MTLPAARGRCQGGSIACSDCGDHIYQCAKFGACFQKCTNIAYLGAKPLDYVADLGRIGLFFYHSSSAVQTNTIICRMIEGRATQPASLVVVIVS